MIAGTIHKEQNMRPRILLGQSVQEDLKAFRICCWQDQEHTSSPSGFARPTAHETLLLCGRVVGTEVGTSLVRLSPNTSWTRGSWSTSDCGHGPSSAPEHAS